MNIDGLHKKRIRKLFLSYTIAIVVLLCYALFLKYTGHGIGCPLYELTHIKCPCCGISHFSVELLSFRLKEALSNNYMAPAIYGLIIWLLVEGSVRYIKDGIFVVKVTLIKRVFVLIFAIIMVVWMILRNVMGI